MFHKAQIIKKYAASLTVMILELDVAPSLSKFEPGQWVDFVVPPRDENKWVVGFSIASSPKDLPRLKIAVKQSNHLPATWVHEKSTVGCPVEVQLGGSCTLVDKAEHRPAVFCAGGIGISPVLSQYREYVTRRRQIGRNSVPCAFLYSVSGEDDLVMIDELVDLVRHDCSGSDKLILTLTRQSKWEKYPDVKGCPNVEFKIGRQLKTFLTDAPNDSIFYICGPKQMLDDAVSQLEKSGTDSRDIVYERWW